MATEFIARKYVNNIVQDLVKPQDRDTASLAKIDGQNRKKNAILAVLHDAILNTEQYTLAEWEDLHNSVQKLATLKSHVDLIVELREGSHALSPAVLDS